MNKYQEALDNLVHCKSITRCKECKHKSHCTMERDSNIIKQALERLEELEHIITTLKKAFTFKLGIDVNGHYAFVIENGFGMKTGEDIEIFGANIDYFKEVFKYE